jgi:FlaA1/EpsC-like NDP-sugar epimerase
MAAAGRSVLVWGVGTHTRHLLTNGALDRLAITAFVDSDPKYHGARLRGVPVISPDDVVAHPEPIIVSSGTVHHEVARQIRDDLHLENEIVLLYE